MKSHRGLSAVVGTVFLIAVVIGALSYISYSIDVMGNFSEQLIAEESRQRDIQDEKFELVTVDIVSNKLDATIKNTGEIPIKITSMYLDEMGDNTDVVQKIDIDQTIAPGNSFDFFSESIDVDMDSTKGYSMKLVTSRGETQTFYLNSAGQEPLDVQLIALPNRIPTGFSTTIMMVVVNNMSNNNPLVNLTPIEPACSGICAKLTGPVPASYGILKAGDVAVFEWVYELEGDNDESVTFESGLVGGVSGNTASETVTITAIQSSELAGQSIESLGFGQSTTVENLLVLHLEAFGIPSNADYQMHPSVPDDLGQNFIFDGTEDQLQFFSANATRDTAIAAGNWNASLRYNHDRLPPAMTAQYAESIYSSIGVPDGKSDGGGGHTLHFNTNPTIARKDSGTWSTCTSLVNSGTLAGATWGADIGVNGSGAYFFDGAGDSISITNSGTKKICNYADSMSISIAGWFNSTAVNTSTRQYIFSKSGATGGYNVWLGNSGSDGKLGFQFYDAELDSVNCWAQNDYTDNNWHHFVGVKDSLAQTCQLYVDGVLKVTSTNGLLGHEHEATEAIYIGAKDGTSNFFTGVIDDIMYWNGYALTASDVTSLFQYSFGADATKLNVVLSNSTGLGVTDTVLSSSLSFGVPWSDQMDYTDLDGTWAGGNWTSGYLNEVVLSGDSPFSRLNFTIGYASGAPLTLRVDDSAINGVDTNAISSYIQTPPADPELPVYHTYDNDDKVTFFAFNTAGSEGVWFTYQGTRIIFNGTGGHYTGIVDTVSNGVVTSTLSADTDSPFIADDVQADIVFWHPQSIPTNSPPSTQEKIPVGYYDVTIYLNGYDEDGTVFIRSIGVGTVLVIE